MEKPTSGDIYINDVKISDYDSKTLLQNMSVLFQDFRKYSNPYSSVNY